MRWCLRLFLRSRLENTDLFAICSHLISKIASVRLLGLYSGITHCNTSSLLIAQKGWCTVCVLSCCATPPHWNQWNWARWMGEEIWGCLWHSWHCALRWWPVNINKMLEDFLDAWSHPHDLEHLKHDILHEIWVSPKQCDSRSWNLKNKATKYPQLWKLCYWIGHIVLGGGRRLVIFCFQSTSG